MKLVSALMSMCYWIYCRSKSVTISSNFFTYQYNRIMHKNRKHFWVSYINMYHVILILYQTKRRSIEIYVWRILCFRYNFLTKHL